MNIDIFWMNEALKEAKKALGMTSPNPMVGAVIVKDNVCIGRGYHKKSGTCHAEVEALKNCQQDPCGATIYVTLEPCSSFGKTPPCVQSIINAKITRCVFAIKDPNEKHQGKAIQILERHNIEISYNILEDECYALNKSFFHWIKYNKPLVTLKMAMTLDGKIASNIGNSKWISNESSRQKVQELRKLSDAIMVGGATFLYDNPSLEIKDKTKKLLKIVWTNKDKDDFKENKQQDFIIKKPLDSNQWQDFLQELGTKQITNLLVEGGGNLAGNLFDNNVVDELYMFIAPKILGGKNATSVIQGIGNDFIKDSWQLQNINILKFDNDICIHGFIK